MLGCPDVLHIPMQGLLKERNQYMGTVLAHFRSALESLRLVSGLS